MVQPPTWRAAPYEEAHSPTLNRAGLRIDDLSAAVAWLTGQGVRFAPIGALVELAQALPDVASALGG